MSAEESASNPEEGKGSKFLPFVSCVSPGFWQVLYDKILDNEKSATLSRQGSVAGKVITEEPKGIDENEIPVWGYYGPSLVDFNSKQPIFNVDHTSFNEKPAEYFLQYPAQGKVIIVNSPQTFRCLDKNSLIARHICSIDNIHNNPTQLVTFIILTYADLKHYTFTYWFGFPAVSSLILEYELPPSRSLFGESSDVISKILEEGKTVVNNGFFAINTQSRKVQALENVMEGDDVEYCYIDPSTIDDIPGWPIRNYAAYVLSKRNTPSGSKMYITGIQPGRHRLCENVKTFVYTVNFPDGWRTNLKVLGWEKNDNKYTPKTVDLKSSLDPIALSEASVDFNLKLMKWRLFPEFDLDRMHKYNVCLLGAGTLGCNVARCLMGWGIRNITIIDSGKVSYSNPVRQTLFNYKDAGEPKAARAAKNLKEIFPGVNARGLPLFIPMPGHPPIAVEKTKQDFAKLEEIIKNSDVLFLLTDTRESRWLPTVLGAAHNKLVMNAALGFDSYVVMRHGKEGENLGCYFCTDVVVPGNSTTDRTLDQQCTVSRPGVSMIAAALVVELMTAVLHYPEVGSDRGCTLGIPPHSLRGFLSSGQFISPSFQKFDKCSGCSKEVIDEFRAGGIEFVLRVMSDPKVLERVSGLDELSFGTDGIVELDDDEGFD